MYRSLINVASLGTLFFAFYYLGESPGTRPDIGSLDPSLALILALLVAKHVTIVAAWAVDSVYERASVESIRPRERLYATLVGLFAAGSVLAMPAEILATIVAIVIVPKFLFDLREAGIGPSSLTFDPTCDWEVEEIPLPTASPRTVFRTNRQAVSAAATVLTILPFSLFFGLVVFGSLAGVTHTLVGLDSGLWGWIGVITATFVFVYGVTFLVVWIEYGDLEFRVYDDTLVAYDTRLRAVQWRVPLEAIDSVSVTHSVFTLLTPFCGRAVRIEYRGGGPPVDHHHWDVPLERIRYVKDPEAMASAIDRVPAR
ncbi:hypothetical protein [Halovivax gelatinilyticus]|uniref:hypothetical protein n=1 Tax=Halovivax gelatinilyticus TaxID=2961597 RepID=UPI0020CA3BE6|nr:hypothetical protein [Halovivax gelatinilyticus]